MAISTLMGEQKENLADEISVSWQDWPEGE
jgi:hypothetical protein